LQAAQEANEHARQLIAQQQDANWTATSLWEGQLHYRKPLGRGAASCFGSEESHGDKSFRHGRSLEKQLKKRTDLQQFARSCWPAAAGEKKNKIPLAQEEELFHEIERGFPESALYAANSKNDGAALPAQMIPSPKKS